MQRQGILSWKSPFGFTRSNLNIDDKLGFVAGFILPPIIRHANMIESCQVKSISVLVSGASNATTRSCGARLKWSVNNGDVDELFEEDDDDDECCPVDCVREFKKEEKFLRIMEKAKKSGSLVVVDFYRTSCGSCKYIEKGFSKLCKGSGDQESPVIFLKHNVLDEYDEQSEVAERLQIRYPFFTSIKTESCSKLFQHEIKIGYFQPFLNTHLLILKTLGQVDPVCTNVTGINKILRNNLYYM
ncbi:unnamed protein product [Cuscuta europaea]|uniref:Thioredoxin domain-containing protein n=1 Tax=Cuscuta europaea TaxID=41803 RepID=A0A9P0Z9T1_CUSEU|nr:unnamed protein product [Cuscuta europaea]